VLQDALSRCSREIGAGLEIGVAFERAGVFPPVVVQVFSVGQQTGRLEEMLERLSADYDRQVNTLATRLASILEPALIVALSVFVGFILFATILPILEAGNVL
jgi:type II secretory pathway component PulF